jgi:uncharacterized OB-fold protein
MSTGTAPQDALVEADWLVVPDLAPSTVGRLAPLYAGAAEGRLTLPFCASCALPLELEQQVCDGCGSTEAAWRDVAPEGTVHTVTVVHRREAGLVLTEDPYAVADVELADGHRLLMAGRRPDAPPRIGDAVTITFRHVGGVAVPAFDRAPLPETETPR